MDGWKDFFGRMDGWMAVSYKFARSLISIFHRTWADDFPCTIIFFCACFFFFLSTHPTLPPLLFPNSLLDCHESVSLISSCLLESKTFLYFSKYKSTSGCQRDKLCCASTSVGSGFMSEAYQRRWVREEHWLIMILFASCNYMCRYKSGYKYIIYPAVDQRLENSAGKDDLVCLRCGVICLLQL